MFRWSPRTGQLVDETWVDAESSAAASLSLSVAEASLVAAAQELYQPFVAVDGVPRQHPARTGVGAAGAPRVVLPIRRRAAGRGARAAKSGNDGLRPVHAAALTGHVTPVIDR
jgi:hypothetical protein